MINKTQSLWVVEESFDNGKTWEIADVEMDWTREDARDRARDIKEDNESKTRVVRYEKESPFPLFCVNEK